MDRVYVTLRSRTVIYHHPKKRAYRRNTARNQANELQIIESLDGSGTDNSNGDSTKFSVAVQLSENLDGSGTDNSSGDLTGAPVLYFGC
ncbi:GM15597 [Drosophila sechellia]|uniref:GM15597 n=1 Tax=Drosophila sechellia TaxID=7238 RepID=B4I8E5_DROSE|nr:GM15597 [Drosophila sechellia]